MYCPVWTVQYVCMYVCNVYRDRPGEGKEKDYRTVVPASACLLVCCLRVVVGAGVYQRKYGKERPQKAERRTQTAKRASEENQKEKKKKGKRKRKKPYTYLPITHTPIHTRPRHRSVGRRSVRNRSAGRSVGRSVGQSVGRLAGRLFFLRARKKEPYHRQHPNLFIYLIQYRSGLIIMIMIIVHHHIGIHRRPSASSTSTHTHITRLTHTNTTTHHQPQCAR